MEIPATPTPREAALFDELRAAERILTFRPESDANSEALTILRNIMRSQCPLSCIQRDYWRALLDRACGTGMEASR